MSSDLNRRAMQVFDQICDLDPKQQRAALDEACADDDRLRTAIERLLRHDAADVRDLPPGKGAELIATELLAESDTGLPDQIGRYRVLREIGRGGMGIVYEAEQADPQRRVALKVIRNVNASRELVRRFGHEAYVLGRLQHPGIAHIYESGLVTADSEARPYFAMELIHGERIDSFAQRKAFEAWQILELVARVCDAVQHAHQKGIIHRDLKPANILVTESERHTDTGQRSSISTREADAIGQPKVLDFGVARIADSEQQLVTMQTEVGQLVGTLAYMSPEQIQADADNIDARSDIYALGVILYHLLAKQLPLDLAGKPITEAGRMIRESHPTRLGALNAEARGDIETIVAKAMEKDPALRYQSAAELAVDLRRFINDQPILARPASVLYQLRKFTRRNKALVGAASLAMMLLVGGLIITGSLLISVTRERNAKQDALASKQKALEASEAVTDFFTSMLTKATPGAQGKDVTVREMTDLA